MALRRRPADDTSAREADAAELRDVAQQLEYEGARPKKTWRACRTSGARLLRWLERHDLDLDEIRALSAIDMQGMPIVPAVLLVAYLDDEIIHDDIKPRSVAGELNRIIAWFGGTGWSTGHLNRGADRQKLKALVANHRHDDIEAHVRVPGRPIMADDIEAIAAEINRHRADPTIQPLWVDAMLTFHLTMSVAGMRSGEAATHLRWGWIEDRGTEMRLNTPGGDLLKYQPDPATLVIPAHPIRPDLCAVLQLRRWRYLCEEVGLPTGADDLVFPAVRKTPPEHTPRGVRWWRDRLWVADPMADARTEAVSQGCDDEAVDAQVSKARDVHRLRYADQWQTFALAAGVEARHRFEAVVSQGLRRGVATTMSDNGTPIVAIKQHLRQEYLETTDLYIDSAAGPVDPRPLFNISGLPEVPDTPELDVDALIDPAAAPNSHGGLCEVAYNGMPCGMEFCSHFDIGNGPVAACEAHWARARRGLRGDQLHRPISAHHLRPTCEIDHHGMLCGNKTLGRIDLDGHELHVCSGHRWRYEQGWTGDELTKPMGKRPLTGSCEIVHNGDVCGRDTTNGRRIDLDGERVECCSAHAQRAAAGKTGDELTGPIRESNRRRKRSQTGGS